MTDAPPAPAAAELVADVECRARRFETPCGDASLVWRAWGAGPPVVLAHGSHGAWSHWIRNIDALAAERTVWAPDLPGYGESAAAPRADHAAISEALGAGLRRLIAAQVDAIWGEHDRPHPAPALQEDVLRRVLPAMDFRVIANAGHWAMYEQPDAFNRAMLDLLAAPLRRAA